MNKRLYAHHMRTKTALLAPLIFGANNVFAEPEFIPGTRWLKDAYRPFHNTVFEFVFVAVGFFAFLYIIYRLNEYFEIRKTKKMKEKRDSIMNDE